MLKTDGPDREAYTPLLNPDTPKDVTQTVVGIREPFKVNETVMFERSN